MPILATLRRPPAPTCEDCWDEDTQNPFTDSRTANVAVKRSKSSEFDPKSAAEKKSHDGSDSGYSSKAGTSDDMSTPSMKKGVDLKLNTKIERERTPYTYAPSARPEETRTSSPTKTKTVKIEKPAKQPQIRYPPGMPPAYDQYGFPYDYEREIQRPATVAPAQKVKSKEDSEGRPTNSRRSSSSSRPVSMYGALPYGAPPMAADYTMYPASAHPGWQMPSNYQYPAYQYAYPPPSSAAYAPSPGYFDVSPMPFSQGQDPFYTEPAPRGYEDSVRRQRSTKKEGPSQRTTSHETRQRSSTKSKPSAEADRLAMPPPSRPTIPRKAPTDYPSISSRRDSVLIDDDEALDLRNAIKRERNTSSSRPPSSYRPAPEAEIHNRPRTRKSQSYSTPSGTVHVASSLQREMSRRRTDPLDTKPLEQKLAEVENYVARNRATGIEGHVSKSKKYQEREPEELDPRITNRRSYAFEGLQDYLTQRMSSGEYDFEDAIAPKKRRDADQESYTGKANRASLKKLTAETLQIMEKQSAGISDVESIHSKESSSRDSAAGRTRAGTAVSGAFGTSITMGGGVSLNIPADYSEVLNIMLNNVQLSINPNTSAPREDDRIRDLKRIERAPSEVSHSSRRSLTNDSAVSMSKEQQAPARQKHSGYSSKRSSRAVSTTRPDRQRGEVRSIDYSVSDYPESYYLGEYI